MDDNKMSQDCDAIILNLANELGQKLGRSSLRQVHSLNMHKVPEEMSMPKELFEPRLVSLGPIHHGLPKLRAMEDQKKRYAARLLERRRGLTIRDFIEGIEKIENNLRHKYGEVIVGKYSKEKFVEMMFIDGAFLIEFLIRLCCEKWEEMDRMPQKRWTLLVFDILLLENQLPILLLENLLLSSRIRDEDSSIPPIQKLIRTFLDESEFLWNRVGKQLYKQEVSQEYFHILGFLPFCMGFPPSVQHARTECTTFLKLPCSPTISKLHRAGVKFRHNHINYVEFAHFILEIPILTIDENTERLFANLLAYEMCNGEVHQVSDYVAMMDYLIDGPEDIKILAEHGIIQNFLEDDEAASSMINNLGKSIAKCDDFHYSLLVEELITYSKSRRARCQGKVFKWKKDLKQNYIGNPWKLLSTIAVVAILLLTVIQTVCSIHQLK